MLPVIVLQLEKVFVVLLLILKLQLYYYYLIYKMLYYSIGELNINNHNPQI